MSDPNTMPGAMMQEEKKASQLFIEQYKERDVNISEYREGYAFDFKEFYKDRSDLLGTRRFGTFRGELRDEKAQLCNVPFSYSELPEQKMGYKQRKKQERLYESQLTLEGNSIQGGEEYLRSLSGIYNPDEEVKIKKKSDAPSKEMIEEVLNTTYNPEEMFNPVNFVLNINAITETMRKINKVYEYCGIGTDYYEKASSMERVKIQYTLRLIRLMDRCYNATLKYYGVEFNKKGKLVKCERSELEYEDRLATLSREVNDRAIGEAEAMKNVINWNISRRRNESAGEENTTKRGVNTVFGAVDSSESGKFISKTLESMNKEVYKDAVSKHKELLEDMLSMYINNSRAKLDILNDIDGLNREIGREQLNLSKPGISVEEHQRLSNYIALLQAKVAELENTGDAYNYTNESISSIISFYLRGRPEMTAPAMRFLAQGKYGGLLEDKKKQLQKERIDASLYADSAKLREEELQEAIKRRFPDQSSQKMAYESFYKRATAYLMRPGDVEYNDRVLDMVLKKVYVDMEVDFRLDFIVKNELTDEMRDKIDDDDIEVSSIAESVVKQFVQEIMELDLSHFELTDESLIKNLPELTELSLKITGMKNIYTWEANGGGSMLDKALGLTDTTEDAPEEMKKAYFRNDAIFNEKIDMLEGLCQWARGVAMKTEGSKHGDLSERLTWDEYQQAQQMNLSGFDMGQLYTPEEGVQLVLSARFEHEGCSKYNMAVAKRQQRLVKESREESLKKAQKKAPQKGQKKAPTKPAQKKVQKKVQKKDA
ncbi:MAG: hypothetical protein K5988_02050 [Lachnospiraceae bacterium]|nr:hypothetical protein [Lachnospiraceae bacterium]